MELLSRWYHERGSRSIELSKLWLFENAIGDAGAAACASLFHEGLLEVHLSHNNMSNTGQLRGPGVPAATKTLEMISA